MSSEVKIGAVVPRLPRPRATPLDPRLVAFVRALAKRDAWDDDVVIDEESSGRTCGSTQG
jgi:hypothetical protein